MKKLKYFTAFYLFITLIFQGGVPLYSKDIGSSERGVYIKEFLPGPGIAKIEDSETGKLPVSGEKTEDLHKAPETGIPADPYQRDIFMFTANIVSEIRLYMMEAVVNKDGFYPVSSEVARKRMEQDSGSENKYQEIRDSAVFDSGHLFSAEEFRFLMVPEIDYLISGTVDITGDEFIMEAGLYELGKDMVVREKRKGRVKFKNDIFVDRASKALVEWLLEERGSRRAFFAGPDPLERFYSDMERAERDFHRSFASGGDVDISHFSRKSRFLIRSPLFRAGYGGFGLASPGGLIPVGEKNKLLPDHYDSGHEAILDFFFYRSKDPEGNGIDLFMRGIFRQYDMTVSGVSDTFDFDIGDESDFIGLYGDPVESGTMRNYGGDLGLRFVRSAYFSYMAWSFYISGALRFTYLDEAYITENGEKVSRDFYSRGFAGGAGMEIAFTPYTGIFTELNYGYTPVGRNRINVDGLRLLYGVTFRTNHWSF